MSHETLQALYALDVTEVGDEEAAKRWEMYNTTLCTVEQRVWMQPPKYVLSGMNKYPHLLYRRKPGIPWPKVMQPEFEAWIKHYKKQHHPKCDLLEAAGFDSMGNKCTCLECIKNDLQNATHEWPADAPENKPAVKKISGGMGMIYENPPSTNS